jgi:tetrahydromethanopterin S-methyltransferase subunit B
LTFSDKSSIVIASARIILCRFGVASDLIAGGFGATEFVNRVEGDTMMPLDELGIRREDKRLKAEIKELEAEIEQLEATPKRRGLLAGACTALLLGFVVPVSLAGFLIAVVLAVLIMFIVMGVLYFLVDDDIRWRKERCAVLKRHQ